MSLATLTSKGQITISKKVRKSLHLNTGDKIDFVLKSDRKAILKPVKKSVDDMFYRLYKDGKKMISVKR